MWGFSGAVFCILLDRPSGISLPSVDWWIEILTKLNYMKQNCLHVVLEQRYAEKDYLLNDGLISRNNTVILCYVQEHCLVCGFINIWTFTIFLSNLVSLHCGDSIIEICFWRKLTILFDDKDVSDQDAAYSRGASSGCSALIDYCLKCLLYCEYGILVLSCQRKFSIFCVIPVFPLGFLGRLWVIR